MEPGDRVVWLWAPRGVYGYTQAIDAERIAEGLR
jgi:hypothetical protein